MRPFLLIIAKLFQHSPKRMCNAWHVKNQAKQNVDQQIFAGAVLQIHSNGWQEDRKKD